MKSFRSVVRVCPTCKTPFIAEAEAQYFDSLVCRRLALLDYIQAFYADNEPEMIRLSSLIEASKAQENHHDQI